MSSIVFDGMKAWTGDAKTLFKDMLDTAQMHRVKKVVIQNAHLLGRELDYVLLYWTETAGECIPEIEIQTTYKHAHPLLEGLPNVTWTLLEPAATDATGIPSGLTRKVAVRDWVMQAFAQGRDPREWASTEPALAETLASWKECVWLGNSTEQTLQIVAFYAALWRAIRKAG
jgi:hypothetical protein